MYLYQQLQSILLRNALQFHAVRSFSVQDIIHKLVHVRPTGYFLPFFLFPGEFSYLEELNDVLCPCWSLRLDGKD